MLVKVTPFNVSLSSYIGNLVKVKDIWLLLEWKLKQQMSLKKG